MRNEFVVLKERKFYINIFVVIFILRFLILHGKIKSSGEGHQYMKVYGGL